MTESEKLLKFIKDNGYDKKFDEALKESKEKADKIIEEWQTEYALRNNQ